MKECQRWIGPPDKIGLDEVARTGATGAVTALHDNPNSEVRSVEDIEDRKPLIEGDPALGLTWEMVESLLVPEDIRHGSGNLDALFANCRQSLANLVACGVAPPPTSANLIGSAPGLPSNAALLRRRTHRLTASLLVTRGVTWPATYRAVQRLDRKRPAKPPLPQRRGSGSDDPLRRSDLQRPVPYIRSQGAHAHRYTRAVAPPSAGAV